MNRSRKALALVLLLTFFLASCIEVKPHPKYYKRHKKMFYHHVY